MLQIYPLFRLQQLDSRISLLERQLGASGEDAEIQKKIRVRERKLAEAESARQSLRTRLKDAELRLASIESHIRDINKRLYSGSTTNSKELAGYAQELEMLKGQKSGLEDDVLSLMEQVETLNSEADAIRGRLEKAHHELEAQHARSGASKKELESQLHELQEKRAVQAAEIEAVLLSRYEKLRQRKDGVAVARIEGNSCGECGTAVLESVKRHVQERQLEVCSYCERILFTD